jgi:hypothetical protein
MTLTTTKITVNNGGGQYANTGHHSTYRVYLDAVGVEFICRNRRFIPLTTQRVVRRETVTR